MRILNIGSINIDDVFAVEHFVQPGETMACRSYTRFIGGKGNNQSVALARAGATVFHAGKIGSDGTFILESLTAAGVDVSKVLAGDVPTGRALIQVRDDGQNCIILAGGANHAITRSDIDDFLAGWGPGDAVIFQNEISCLDYALAESKRKGLAVFLNPSPVTAQVVELPINSVDYLLVNEVEGEALSGESDPDLMLAALGRKYPAVNVVLTLGENGVRYAGADGSRLARPALKVDVVDTTAAGDTFTGYFVTGILGGESVPRSLDIGIRAAALCVGRRGASASIPSRGELGVDR